MPWFRDLPSPRGPRLRTLVVLVVLGLVVALVAEIPLGVVGGMPTGLTLGGRSTVAGSVPPPGASGESELSAASKHKGGKKGKHKRGKKGKHKGGKKGKRAKSPDGTATSRKKPRPTPTPSPTPPPPAAGETTPVPHGGDAADDPAIWIHPTDPGQSTIIGTDKRGGLAVYDLAGNELAYYPDSTPNNVDLRYNFPLGGERVALVVTSDTTTDSLRTYRIDPATRQLIDVAARTSDVGIGVAGLCSYVSPATGRYYAFVGDSSGTVQQWELVDDGSGKVVATKVRTLSIGSTTEGCVADDVTGDLYIAEEDVAIWKYGAEPDAGRERTRVDGVGSGGHLTADIEGLAIYYRGGGGGYLLASSQGSDAFVVYERGGTNAYVTTFSVDDGAVDGVSHTDGLDVTNAGLGTAFPDGLFVAQDDRNDGGNQNFKLVPWGDVARAASPALAIDTGWDPRRVGG